MRWLLLICLLALTPVRTVHGATIFLKIKSAPGEAQEPGRQDWIEVIRFEQGLSKNLVAGSPPQSGARFLNERMILEKRLDKASPLLMKHLNEGTVLSEARLELVTDDEERLRFYEIILSDVLIESTRVHGETESERPTETVSLYYDKIRWTYTEIDPNGEPLADHSASWDFIRGAGRSRIAPKAFEVRGVQPDRKSLKLQWKAQQGRKYKIKASASVFGPYHDWLTHSAEGEQAELVLPFNSAMQFFTVEEETQ